MTGCCRGSASCGGWPYNAGECARLSADRRADQAFVQVTVFSLDEANPALAR
jgi:hypothetical protein